MLTLPFANDHMTSDNFKDNVNVGVIKAVSDGKKLASLMKPCISIITEMLEILSFEIQLGLISSVYNLPRLFKNAEYFNKHLFSIWPERSISVTSQGLNPLLLT